MKGWKLFAPLLLLVIISITLYLRLHTQPLLLQGEADAIEVIVASKAKGRVEHLHVRRGDDVQKGQLLISLSSPELQAQLDSLRAAREETLRALQASLQQAQAELRNAELDFQRNEELAGRGFVSQAQLDTTRRARDVARNQVAEAQANLDQGAPTRRSSNCRRRPTTWPCSPRWTARSGPSRRRRAS